MSAISKFSWMSAILIFIVGCINTVEAAVFTGIGIDPGIMPSGISGDGKTVIGFGAGQVAKWSPEYE